MDNTIRCVCKNLFGGSRVRGGVIVEATGLVAARPFRVGHKPPGRISHTAENKGADRRGVKSATVTRQTPIDTRARLADAMASAASLFRVGARIAAAPAKKGAQDALRGTQHLLTQAGRDILAAHYQAGFGAGAQVAHPRPHAPPHRPVTPPSSHTSCVASLTSGSARPACGA